MDWAELGVENIIIICRLLYFGDRLSPIQSRVVAVPRGLGWTIDIVHLRQLLSSVLRHLLFGLCQLVSLLRIPDCRALGLVMRSLLGLDWLELGKSGLIARLHHSSGGLGLNGTTLDQVNL